jgi:uncharacterized protein YndB with AHSA1/START domain
MGQQLAVERSVWIDTPIERAWKAVTEPEQLTQWYATNYSWEIPTLAVGARIRFHNSDTEALGAAIEVVDPPREFTVRWDPSAHYGVVLVTSFRLAEENGGTRVTIYESGYESVPADERQEWIDATGVGYAMSVENLKAHLEGQTLPHQ